MKHGAIASFVSVHLSRSTLDSRDGFAEELGVGRRFEGVSRTVELPDVVFDSVSVKLIASLMDKGIQKGAVVGVGVELRGVVNPVDFAFFLRYGFS